MASLCRISIALAAALAAATPAAAADFWSARHVHGSVFALVDDQWAELQDGDDVASGVAVRTLQAGSVELVRHNESLGLAAGTVVRATATGGAVTVEQFAGRLSLTNIGTAYYTLKTPSNVATANGASFDS